MSLPSAVVGRAQRGQVAQLAMVAGAPYTQEKRIFPPVEAIDIQFEYRGKALVPASGYFLVANQYGALTFETEAGETGSLRLVDLA